MPVNKRFCLVLVKPSHYDDDGYVIQWLRSPIPSTSLAALYGLAKSHPNGSDIFVGLFFPSNSYGGGGYYPYSYGGYFNPISRNKTNAIKIFGSRGKVFGSRGPAGPPNRYART